MHLLLLANDKDRTITLNGERVNIKRGQLAWSLFSLQKKFEKGRKWLLAFFEFCKEEGMISVQTSQRGTLTTILNYGAYNLIPKSTAQAGSQKEVHTSGQEKDSLKEWMIPPGLLEDVCESFVDSARGIKKIPFNWSSMWLVRYPEFPKDHYYSEVECKQAFADMEQALKLAFVADWDSGRYQTWLQQTRNKLRAEINQAETLIATWLQQRKNGVRKPLIEAEIEVANLDHIEMLEDELEQLKDC